MSCLEDPQKPFNRPGLPALTYRLGDYNSFLARLLDRLICKLDLGQAQEISLQKLTTRVSEDPAIALLDACAVVADVLTFYQERIINEGYILTATERQSVLEMARAIGYELDPGVAASTFLAFTMDDTPNSPNITIIPPGTQIMSVPGQDELPQTFETTEEFIARINWNALKPRSQRPQKITTSTRKLYLDGINTQLQPGDSILLMDGDGSDRKFYFLTLDTVQAIAATGHTLITWNRLLPKDSFKTLPRNPTIYAFRQKANLFGHNAPLWSDLPNETKVANGSKVKGGVYLYEPESEQKWKSINQGLNNFDVRCLVANSEGDLFAGTANGIFRSQDKGETWTAVNSGLNNTNVQTILITENNEILAGTAADGVFLSTDNGGSWSSIGIGQVKTTTTGTPSNQTTVSKMIPNTVVRSLTKISASIFAGTDAGLYITKDRGLTWKQDYKDSQATPQEIPDLKNNPIRSLTGISNLILVRTDSGAYKSVNNGDNWSSISLPTSTKILVAAVETIFVGASDGMYQSSDGSIWTLIGQASTGLSDPKAWAIAVNRSREQNATNRHLFAFTPSGIFKSINNGSSWNLYTNNSTNIDLKTVTACVTGKDDADEQLFAGTLFTGFDNSSNLSNPSQKQTDWIDFEIPKLEKEGTPPIDLNTLYLDTLYPRILADTWMVLKTGDRFTPFKIKDVSAKQQKQFTLDSKVTRLSIDRPQNSEKLLESFQELRESIVFAQSEIISLAPDPLTIPAQQSKIFFDPIIENRVFLSQYVVGLQTQQRVIISGKRMRIEVKNIAGVAQLLGTNEEKWVRINAGLTNINATCLVNSGNNLFVGTTGGGVFYSTDDGQLWKSTTKGLNNLNIQTLILSDNYLFAGTAGDGIFRLNSSDLDSNWEEKNENLIHRNLQVLIKLKNDVILAGTIDGGVYQSSNNGERWSQTYLDNTDVRALCELNNGDILAGTIDNGVWRSQDEGFTWQPLNAGLIERNITNVTALLAYQNNASQEVILAGTAGSGLFRLTFKQEDGKTIEEWKPISLNPTDLNINCLTYDTQKKQILAGTVSGGVFISLDDGDRWKPLNKGLTCVNEQINPTQKVNTNIQAISEINKQIFAVGTGILISADGLYTVPIRSGDRLQVLAPPEPLGSPDPDVAEIDERKWLLEDVNGFQGLVFTANSEDARLEPAAKEDRIVSELAVILKPPFDRQEPILKLLEPIKNIYDPETVEIYANVVAANHGETITEVIGSGDGTATNQKFLLQKPPLTHVAASTASGFSSTLQVRVNEVLWQEVPSLYQRQPQEQVYITRIADDRTATIAFGDGKSGNRLPSGRENIVATYRTGIGLEGQVNANQLTLLKTRPLGISQVNNPLPATGAADPETMAEAQISAPLTTRTLDRIVSLQDYEDFARAFAGIGKAQAIALWTGNIQQVHITIGAIGGKLVLPETALYENLVSAIENSRDPLQQVQVDSYELLQFNLAAKLTIDPRYLTDKVIARVETILKTRFAFEERNFGQAVTAAEAIATMQSIEGVIAVDLDALHRLDLPLSLEQSLPSLPARWDAANNRILPAQLLLLNPAEIRLNVEVVR